MGIFNRHKEPTFGQHMALTEEGRPQPNPAEGMLPTENIAHLFSVDEITIEMIERHPELGPCAIVFGPTADTNYLDGKGVELTQIRIRKSFLKMMLAMPKSRRRELLAYVDFLRTNALTRAYNNRRGEKLRLLTTLHKRIIVGEAKKEPAL